MTRRIHIPTKPNNPFAKEKGSGQHLLNQVRSLEAMVRELSRDLYATQKISKTGSFYWDKVKDKRTWTETAASLFGFEDKVSMESVDWEKIIFPEDWKSFQIAWEGVRKEQIDFDLVFRVKASNDRIIKIHCSGIPVYNSSDLFLGVFGNFREVSELSYSNYQASQLAGIFKQRASETLALNNSQLLELETILLNSLEDLNQRFHGFSIDTLKNGANSKFEERKSRTMLIVDDEPSVREILGDVFISQGFKVFFAENGKIALDIFNQNEIENVLCDIYMPEKNGLELLNDIKNASKKPPKFFLISGNPIQMSLELHEKGCSGIIEKPFQIREILNLFSCQFVS